MNDNQMNSGKKRYSSERTAAVLPQCKRRKSSYRRPHRTEIISTINQLHPVASERTTITDLNDECLEIIFKCLTAQELLNVAAANKWLNASAGPVFRHTHGQKLIQLSSISIQNNSELFVADQMVLASGLKVCLQFLRCFGPYTSKLSVQFGNSSKKCVNYINQYVNEYCSESLVHITFHEAEAESVKRHVRKPYENVKSIYITESRLIKQLPQFNHWFPNVQRLELVFNAFDPKFAGAHLPNLQELRLFLISQYKLRDTLLKYMTCLLQRNSHIKCLEIDIQLQSATVCSDLLTFDEFLASIRENSAITTLRTSYGFGFYAISVSNLFEMAHKLPFLIEIDLKPYQLSVDDVICFIRQHKLLKYFQFTIDRPSKFNHLQMQLGDEWQSSFSMDKWKSSVVTLMR